MKAIDFGKELARGKAHEDYFQPERAELRSGGEAFNQNS
jgi:hypothetical protein